MRKLLVFFFIISMGSSPLLPVTGTSSSEHEASALSTRNFLPILGLQHSADQFKRISKIVLPNQFAFDVIEQPANNSGFVSSAENTLTHFGLAAQYGSTGILAHNHLAGASFLDLQLGNRIDLVTENGDQGQVVEYYWVFSIRKFQALSPTSPYSEFIDLKSQKRYSASELFLEIYDQDDMLILQTCIKKDGEDSWGRIFVIAYPLSAQFYEPWPQGIEMALVH